jgi:hypothetical protein
MDDMPVLPPAGPDSNVFAGDDRENAGGADADRAAEARARDEARSEDDAQLTEAARRDDVVEGADEAGATVEHERAEPESRTEDADLLASQSRGDNEETERARADREEFQPVDDERPAPDEAMVDSTATAADASVIDKPADQRVDEPTDERVDEPADQRVDEPTDERVDEPADQRVDERVDDQSHMDRPATDGTGQALAPGDVEAEPVRDLWPENAVAGLRDRWRDIQLRFVDDPASAARDADSLVGEAIDNLTMSLGDQRTELARWQQSDSTDDTEQLRVAVQRYRGFLDKLLDL